MDTVKMIVAIDYGFNYNIVEFDGNKQEFEAWFADYRKNYTEAGENYWPLTMVEKDFDYNPNIQYPMYYLDTDSNTLCRPDGIPANTFNSTSHHTACILWQALNIDTIEFNNQRLFTEIYGNEIPKNFVDDVATIINKSIESMMHMAPTLGVVNIGFERDYDEASDLHAKICTLIDHVNENWTDDLTTKWNDAMWEIYQKIETHMHALNFAVNAYHHHDPESGDVDYRDKINNLNLTRYKSINPDRSYELIDNYQSLKFDNSVTDPLELEILNNPVIEKSVRDTAKTDADMFLAIQAAWPVRFEHATSRCSLNNAITEDYPMRLAEKIGKQIDLNHPDSLLIALFAPFMEHEHRTDLVTTLVEKYQVYYPVISQWIINKISAEQMYHTLWNMWCKKLLNYQP